MNRPNVVMITTHDLGRHLHCYGAATVRSESLDRLGARGVRFENAFCTAPQCSPARAALATGRYPHSNGVMGLSHGDFAWHLPEREVHLAGMLRDGGYDTALFGIQHVTAEEKVADLGFEEREPGGQSRCLAPKVAAWLRDRARPGSGRPFYVEVGFADTHRPWGTNPPEWSLGTQRPRWLPPYPGSDEEMARFQGEILAMDVGVGKILEALEDSGQLDDTMVVFTSDHGVAIPRAKGTLYDPGIEVPLIVHWPGGGVERGLRRDLVSHVDVVPTVLDALGMATPGSVQGRSLWPSLSGGSFTPRREVFAEKTYHTTYDPLRGVRTERHKLIVHFGTYDVADVPIDAKASPSYEVLREELTAQHPCVELFDLYADPLERHNLAFEPEASGTLFELMGRLRAWMGHTDDPLLAGMVPSPSYERALSALAGGPVSSHMARGGGNPGRYEPTRAGAERAEGPAGV